jgi:predicted small integral membrane protein
VSDEFVFIRRFGFLTPKLLVARGHLNRKAKHNQKISSFKMSEYRPKISERLTDELIEIANSSTEVWQQEAINQAKSELIKRNVTENQQDGYFEQKVREIDDYYENEELKRKANETEKYNIFAMILIVIISPFILIRPWSVLYQLKQENYNLKFKQRIILLTLGMIIWFGSFYYKFDKWQKTEFNKESRY